MEEGEGPGGRRGELLTDLLIIASEETCLGGEGRWDSIMSKWYCDSNN